MPIPFVSRYFTYPRFDHRYLHTLFNLVTDKYSLLVPWYVVSYDPIICLQANQTTFHQEGPEYIYPSSGWTNPTIDPYASTHTFRILNPTFITTHLRSGV